MRGSCAHSDQRGVWADLTKASCRRLGGPRSPVAVSAARPSQPNVGSPRRRGRLGCSGCPSTCLPERRQWAGIPGRPHVGRIASRARFVRDLLSACDRIAAGNDRHRHVVRNRAGQGNHHDGTAGPAGIGCHPDLACCAFRRPHRSVLAARSPRMSRRARGPMGCAEANLEPFSISMASGLARLHCESLADSSGCLDQKSRGHRTSRPVDGPGHSCVRAGRGSKRGPIQVTGRPVRGDNSGGNVPTR